MDNVKSLKGRVLIATPSHVGSVFHHALIYICECQPEGVIGLIINKPIGYQLNFMFDLLHIKDASLSQKNRSILYGGPLHAERGFVLHRPSGHWQSSVVIDEHTTVTTSTDIIQSFAKDEGPQDALVILGFVGWDRGQLEQEMMENRWLIGLCTPELLYDTPLEMRWSKITSSMGIDLAHFVEGGGHA